MYIRRRTTCFDFDTFGDDGPACAVPRDISGGLAVGRSSVEARGDTAGEGDTDGAEVASEYADVLAEISVSDS